MSVNFFCWKSIQNVKKTARKNIEKPQILRGKLKNKWGAKEAKNPLKLAGKFCGKSLKSDRKHGGIS